MIKTNQDTHPYCVIGNRGPTQQHAPRTWFEDMDEAVTYARELQRRNRLNGFRVVELHVVKRVITVPGEGGRAVMRWEWRKENGGQKGT